MRDPFQWSIGVGRWGGITVRLHVFFLALTAATLYFAWPAEPSIQSLEHWWMSAGTMFGLAAAAILFLFASVLLHELAHAMVARHAGFSVDTITLGPLGGLTAWRSAVDPRLEVAMFVAGPLANLALALLLALAVLLLHPDHSLRSLLNPLQPSLTLDLTEGLAVGLWINWLLFVVNVLPAHPFDGGRVLRAVLVLSRPAWSDRRVAEVMCGTAVALSAALAVVGTVLAKHDTDSPFPLWSVLLLLAVLLLVGARREIVNVEASAPVEMPEGDQEEGQTMEREAATPRRGRVVEPPSLPWERDMDEVEEPADRAGIEAEEERQVDGILSRLHAHGIDSLTPQERRLLDRVSARYRSRLGKRS
jgi:stage IV sporulation protein FB